MAEWFKAAVLKTASPKGDVGSNPTPSAMHQIADAERHAHSMKSRRDAREAEGARLLSEYPA